MKTWLSGTVASAVPRTTGWAGSVLSSVTVMVWPETVTLAWPKSAVAVPDAVPVVPYGIPAVHVAVAVLVSAAEGLLAKVQV